MFLPLLLYGCFAAIFIISKTILLHAAPFFLVGSRMILAAVLLLTYQSVKRGKLCMLERKQWIPLALFALFGMYLTNVCEFWGLKYLTSAKTCFLYSLTPFISALLAFSLLKEKLNRKKVAGLLLGFVGFIPILLNSTQEEELTGTFFLLSWAELSVVAAAAFSAYGWILLKQLVDKEELSPLTVNGWAMLLGGIAAMAHSYLVENWNPLPVYDWQPFLLWTMLLILLSNIFCYNLYGLLLQRFSATFMSLAGYTTPFFTAFLGWFFLHEQIGFSFYLSSAIVLAALLLFYQEELKLLKSASQVSA